MLPIVKKIVCLVACMIVIFSCKSQHISGGEEALYKIVYSNYGGMSGWEESLMITKDSVLYYSHIARTNKTQKAFEKTSKKTWDILKSSLNTELLKNIKSGDSNLLFDGMDTKYTIIMSSGKEYSFVNASDSEEYKRMELLFNTINDLKKSLIKIDVTDNLKKYINE